MAGKPPILGNDAQQDIDALQWELKHRSSRSLLLSKKPQKPIQAETIKAGSIGITISQIHSNVDVQFSGLGEEGPGRTGDAIRKAKALMAGICHAVAGQLPEGDVAEILVSPDELSPTGGTLCRKNWRLAVDKGIRLFKDGEVPEYKPPVDLHVHANPDHIRPPNELHDHDHDDYHDTPPPQKPRHEHDEPHHNPVVSNPDAVLETSVSEQQANSAFFKAIVVAAAEIGRQFRVAEAAESAQAGSASQRINGGKTPLSAFWTGLNQHSGAVAGF